MHRKLRYLTLPCALLFASACVLGDEPNARSPYDDAFFAVPLATPVADGLTPVSISVHGKLASTLTVQLANAEFFGIASEQSKSEKTLQLVEMDTEGRGVAELQIVSSRAGLAQLSFKLAPLAASAEIEFAAVQIHLDAPIVVGMTPGKVVHKLCVYSNTDRGSLLARATSGPIAQERVEIQTLASSPCPTPERDWIGAAPLLGAAHLQWSGAEAATTIEMDYLGSQDEVLLHKVSEVRGQNFPGYWAEVQDVELTTQWASVSAQLFYEATATLMTSAASEVRLHDLRSVPPGLKLVGSSSGGVNAAPETDSHGTVTLYFELPQGQEPLSVFATPEGGGTMYLGEVMPQVEVGTE